MNQKEASEIIALCNYVQIMLGYNLPLKKPKTVINNMLQQLLKLQKENISLKETKKDAKIRLEGLKQEIELEKILSDQVNDRIERAKKYMHDSSNNSNIIEEKQC